MDIYDKASDIEMVMREKEIERTRCLAKLEQGHSGECQSCGEDSPRIIRGDCPPCRDKYKRR